MSDEKTKAPAKAPSKIKAAFEKAVVGRINGNKDHGWKGEDQLLVVIAVVEAEYGKAPSEELREAIKLQINGSQFRQSLEKLGALNPPPEGGKRKKEVSDFLSSFKS